MWSLISYRILKYEPYYNGVYRCFRQKIHNICRHFLSRYNISTRAVIIHFFSGHTWEPLPKLFISVPGDLKQDERAVSLGNESNFYAFFFTSPVASFLHGYAVFSSPCVYCMLISVSLKFHNILSYSPADNNKMKPFFRCTCI